jgi:AcrR family transcriptional regulator
VANTPIRDRKAKETRERIGETARELFMTEGYAETTIDQIASAAGVSRRTVFLHFPSKAAMLFDHLATRREVLVQRLRERPSGEAPLVSLHAVLRELCVKGYDRRLLAQIRAVIATDPRLGSEVVMVGRSDFERTLTAILKERGSDETSELGLHSLTLMATGWVTLAVWDYLTRGRRSLVKCFDEVVDACMRASANGLG